MIYILCLMMSPSSHKQNNNINLTEIKLTEITEIYNKMVIGKS